MTLLFWIITLIYVLIVLATTTTVLLDNRTPAKTAAWILVLVFLPVIGIILYFFFGQNTRRERYISEHSTDMLTKRSLLEFTEQKNLHIPEEQEVLIKQFALQNWALPFKNNEIEVFTDGYSFFGRLLHDILSATQSIHIVTYIFEDDSLGNLIADALIDKAKQGVEVRLIYDDVGSWKTKNAFWERMRNAGIEVHGFMPVRFPSFTSKINYRNHRKIIVIDGKVAYIGGMNIAKRYISWRDTHLRIQGGAVFGAQRAFFIDWYFVDGTLITNRKYYPVHKDNIENNCVIQIVTCSPISPWTDIMQGYVRILLQSRKYVYMETPYFIPTDAIMFAMQTAASAGVDVRLMIPSKSDARFVQWASTSYALQAKEAGITVYLYDGEFNHTKLLVADDKLCSCGSANIDFRSFENNFEANAFIYDEDFALRMKAIFNEDVEHCRVLDISSRPFFKRLRDSVVRLLAPLL